MSGTPVRVTHVVTADHRRGAELAAVHLIECLAEHGMEQRLVALWPGHHRGGSVGVDALLVPTPPGRGRTAVPRAVVGLRRELRAHPADVVLAHGAQAALVAALAAPGRGGPPFVWQRILQLPDWPAWHPHRLWLRLVAARATGVVALTGATAAEVRALRFRGPVWEVPNHRPHAEYGAHDRGEAARSLRDELGVPADAPLLGFVGHLVAQKRPVAAVEVLARVRRTVPGAQLVVVGDGPRRAGIASRAAAVEVGDAVHLLGHRDDVPRILAGLDVLVLSSRSDSMPGVVVEAQLAGCPVVAFPVDGIGDVLAPGESGIVTSGPDPAEAAAAVAELLTDDELRASMSAAAKEHALHLSTERVAGRYARLLRSAARSGSAVRVLHVLPDLGVGGAEQALAVLARALGPDDAVQAVATVAGARRPLEETVHRDLQRHGVPFCDLGSVRRPTRSLRGLVAAAVRVRSLARRFGADVVDAALLDAALPARLAPGRWARVTHLVNTPWEPVVRDATGTSRWRAELMRRVDRWTSRRDDALVALTGPVADAARRDLGLRDDDPRLVVIPRGVDLERFGPTVTAPATERCEIVSIGRLVPQKAHDVLARAVARVAAGGTDVRCRIVGEGPEQAGLEQLVAGLGTGAVELVGPTRDVAGLLGSADVFALASRWEGQSNAVLEAMASGLPVVVSDVPALREVVGDAGVLVPPGDVAAFAAALDALARDPERRAALGSAARARVEARYDAAERALDLLALYRRLTRR